MSRRPMFAATPDDWRDWCQAAGEKPYRAKQVREWVTKRRVLDFARMSDLPLKLREQLEAEWTVLSSRVHVNSAGEAQTGKLLLNLASGGDVECVLLRAEERRTLCMSTQVGCAMGCVFCASGLEGLERNLEPFEMIEQMLHIRSLLPAEERLSHIVVMGMGEPLQNLDNLLEALEFATSPNGLGIGARNITISTVGLPPKIVKLAESGKSYHLAVSLHAPNEELRRQIVPAAGRVALPDLLAAADEFRRITSRQVTFEYVLLGGVNDHPHNARELATLLAGRDAMINLIPYNPVAGLPYESPTGRRANQFAMLLREAGFTVKTRKRRGSDINAACGQLRRAAKPGEGAANGLVQISGI